MKDIGLDGNDDEEEPGYDMQDEEFYGPDIQNAMHYNVKDVKLGNDAKREIALFKSCLSDCDSLLNRKTDIMQL